MMLCAVVVGKDGEDDDGAQLRSEFEAVSGPDYQGRGLDAAARKDGFPEFDMHMWNGG